MADETKKLDDAAEDAEMEALFATLGSVGAFDDFVNATIAKVEEAAVEGADADAAAEAEQSSVTEPESETAPEPEPALEPAGFKATAGGKQAGSSAAARKAKFRAIRIGAIAACLALALGGGVAYAVPVSHVTVSEGDARIELGVNLFGTVVSASSDDEAGRAAIDASELLNKSLDDSREIAAEALFARAVDRSGESHDADAPESEASGSKAPSDAAGDVQKGSGAREQGGPNSNEPAESGAPMREGESAPASPGQELDPAPAEGSGGGSAAGTAPGAPDVGSGQQGPANPGKQDDASAPGGQSNGQAGPGAPGGSQDARGNQDAQNGQGGQNNQNNQSDQGSQDNQNGKADPRAGDANAPEPSSGNAGSPADGMSASSSASRDSQDARAQGAQPAPAANPNKQLSQVGPSGQQDRPDPSNANATQEATHE